jgi:hypothetical protein
VSLFLAAPPIAAQPLGEQEPPDSDSGAAPVDESDRERLRDVEQQVEILKRKLEVQEEDTALKASRNATAGAGPTASSCARRTGSSRSSCAATRSSTRAG